MYCPVRGCTNPITAACNVCPCNLQGHFLGPYNTSTYVDNAYHLRINSVNSWSNWYWSGQSGQPAWLWGSNDGTNMYVWNPSNFSVNYANSAGSASSASSVTIHYNDNSNSTYQMLWGSGNYVYGTGGIYCNPYTDSLYASAFYETSDERLKDFENSVNVDLNLIRSIPKMYFRWKKNPNKLQMGTSAQAVKQIYPELVSSSEDGILSVDYSKLSIVALSAIDKLHLENQDLKREINILKQEIEKLKGQI